MKLTPIDFAEYREASKFYRSTKIQRLIEEFEAMHVPCVQVVEQDRRPQSVYASIRQYLNRHNITSVDVGIRKGSVFMINLREISVSVKELP